MLFDLTRNKVLPHFHDLVTMSVLARTANIGFLNELHMAKRRLSLSWRFPHMTTMLPTSVRLISGLCFRVTTRGRLISLWITDDMIERV